MLNPSLLFLQACGRVGLRFGCTHHLVFRRSATILPRFRTRLLSTPRNSFVHRTVNLCGIPHPRSVVSQVVTMVKAQDSSANTPIDNEAMLAKGNMIMQRLEEVYPKAPEGFLDHTDPFTLLIAVVLSAQSLDIKVNEITPHLFSVGGTPQEMRALGETKIREIIKQIGLAPQKAKNITKLSEIICEKFDGKVPDTFEGLESLPGVGHKTASVVMMQAFKKPAFPVDTHIHRLACRWGCGDAKSVDKTEAALKLWFPDSSTWGALHTRIILFGREYCPARKHDMDQCPICSFAATDEARAMNRQNPNKFIAPKNHKNPYSIRDVPEVDPADKDPGYTPVRSSSEAKNRKRGTKSRVVQKDEDKKRAVKRTANRRRKGVVKAESLEEDGGTEAPMKRLRRDGKGKTATVEVSEEIGEEDGGMKNMEDGEATQNSMKRGGRRKKQMENSKGVFQGNGEALRRSSRVRAKEVD